MVAMFSSAEPFTTSQPAHVGGPNAADVFAQARAQSAEIDDLVHIDGPKRMLAWIVTLLLLGVAVWIGRLLILEQLGQPQAFSQSFLMAAAVIVAFALFGAIRIAMILQTSAVAGRRFVHRQRELLENVERQWTIDLDSKATQIEAASLVDVQVRTSALDGFKF